MIDNEYIKGNDVFWKKINIKEKEI